MQLTTLVANFVNQVVQDGETTARRHSRRRFFTAIPLGSDGGDAQYRDEHEQCDEDFARHTVLVAVDKKLDGEVNGDML